MKNTLLSLIALGAALSLQPAAAQDAQALFRSKPCGACHAIDAKLVGPSLKDVAARNAGVAGAVDTLAGHIRNGTQGNWGPIPMPANPITEEEAQTLARWVLTLQ